MLSLYVLYHGSIVTQEEPSTLAVASVTMAPGCGLFFRPQ